MTSNHPEKLDPALIRPGRIDKTFHLTYMVGNQAIQRAIQSHFAACCQVFGVSRSAESYHSHRRATWWPIISSRTCERRIGHAGKHNLDCLQRALRKSAARCRKATWKKNALPACAGRQVGWPHKNISGLTLLLDGGVDSKDCSASRSCQTVLSRA